MTSNIAERLTPEELSNVQQMISRLKGIEDVIRISEKEHHEFTQDILRIVKPHVAICQNCHHCEDHGNVKYCKLRTFSVYVNATDSCNEFAYRGSKREYYQ